MEDKKIGVCVICGKEFAKTRSDKKYCTRLCAMSSAGKAARERQKYEIADCGTDCPFNMALICYVRKCANCGWNPDVEKKRMARLKQNGGHKSNG